jgi:hypothetical protein
MRYTVTIDTKINGDWEVTDETFTNFIDALDYANVKAKAWHEVSQTMNTLEWYRVSIEEN